MAAYVKQADQVVLIMSKAEANALSDLVRYAQTESEFGKPVNVARAAAEDRAVRALAAAVAPGSRSGAAIQ